MTIFAGHKGVKLLHRVLKVVNRHPYGMSIAVAIRLLAILIEEHRYQSGSVDVNQVHRELDDLLSAFKLIRGEPRGSA